MSGLSGPEAAWLLQTLRQECRKAVRFPLGSLVRVCRLGGRGGEQAAVAKGLNLSRTGLAFLAAEPMALATQIRVELPHNRLRALATVRNCEQRGSWWRVGVEFQGSFERSWSSSQ